MVSIRKRLTLAGSIILATIVGFMGFAVQQSHLETTEVALKKELQGLIFTLLTGTEVSDTGLLVKDLPEAELYIPGSGLYAQIYSSDDPSRWESPSLLGVTITFPEGIPGQYIYQSSETTEGDFLAVSFTVIWEVESGAEHRYTFSVAKNLSEYNEAIAHFQQNIWGWLVVMAVMLLFIQVVILSWGLKPLRQVADDLVAIKKGDKHQLTGIYPEELVELTSSLNDLLSNERALQTRYRHSLGDLAHSLKTPLAVLQGEAERCEQSNQSVQTFLDQIERMNRIVKYQLHRAVSTGGGTLAAPLTVAPIAVKIINSLFKVYAEKSVQCHQALSPEAVFHGEEGDLYEILGNIIDNAFKWCDRQVVVTVLEVEGRRKRSAVKLVIEDDGPGVPEDKKAQILQRGVRADEKTPGWGIGLSIVTEIVDGMLVKSKSLRVL